MDKLFAQFLMEKRYLAGLAETTLQFYQYCFNAYQRVLSGEKDGTTSPRRALQASDELPTKDTLKDFVIGLQKSGITASTVNCYCRGMNSYLTWLHTEGHISEPLRIKLLRQEKRVVKPLTDAELRRILAYKTTCVTERRLLTILFTLADTGLRIREVIGLERGRVNFDSLYLTVLGKGNKERVVPFSVELRRKLFRHLRTHNFELVFCSRTGSKLRYDNLRRDFNAVLDKVGVKPDGKFHSLRKTFSTNFAREGGNLFALQNILGHASISTTQKYVGLNVEDLKMAHARTSLLRRLG